MSTKEQDIGGVVPYQDCTKSEFTSFVQCLKKTTHLALYKLIQFILQVNNIYILDIIRLYINNFLFWRYILHHHFYTCYVVFVLSI